MASFIVVGKRFIPPEYIAFVEPYDLLTARPQLRTSRWFQGRVVMVNRDSILIEEAPVVFAEANGFRTLAADRTATNPAIAFRVEAFLPVEGFTPSKAFATRLLWRDLDGDEQSKLLLSDPETVLAVVVRGASDKSFAHLQPAQLGAGRKGRLPTPSGSARS